MKNLSLSLLVSTTGCAAAGGLRGGRFIGYRDTSYVHDVHYEPLSFKWHVTQLRNVAAFATDVNRALRRPVVMAHVDVIVADGLRSTELRELFSTDFMKEFGREQGVFNLLHMLALPGWAAASSPARVNFSDHWPRTAAVLKKMGVW